MPTYIPRRLNNAYVWCATWMAFDKRYFDGSEQARMASLILPSYGGIRALIRVSERPQLGFVTTRWGDGGWQRNRSYQVCSLATGPAAAGEGRLPSMSAAVTAKVTEREEIEEKQLITRGHDVDREDEEARETIANGDTGDSHIVSPFSKQQDEQHQSSGLYSAETFELTLENADRVLDEVRPYLISDGGNVEVVSVEDGIISLQLQGACGSCPSSTSTMKMGIERVLREKFGDAFKEVVDVNKPTETLTLEAVNKQVDVLRGAIEGYGGNVEVVSVDSVRGECEIKYKGPVPLGLGIKAAIRDKFPDLNIVLIDA